MTINTHILGYPRIGDTRQSKFALESYWAGKQDKATTQAQLAFASKYASLSHRSIKSGGFTAAC